MSSRRASASWRRTRRRLLLAAATAASAVASIAAAQGSPADLYFERNVMSAANQRCGLFTPELASALDSAAAQARGAALRAGASDQSLAAVKGRAVARAASTACGSKDLQVAAARVRAAFDGYAHLLRMHFPGDAADWSADRTLAQRVMVWRLSQTSRFGADAMSFGLAGEGDSSGLLAVASFADGAQPYAARLVIRDLGRSSGPCLGQPGGGLASRAPLPGARKVFLAQAREAAPQSLLPRGAHAGLAFRFPHGAADALAGLDPREAVAVEFVFGGRGGDSLRTAYVEVGDFAAGRAFLASAQR